LDRERIKAGFIPAFIITIGCGYSGDCLYICNDTKKISAKMKPDLENFDAEVYSIVREIPFGKVVTYGQIARLVGFPRHSRRVGKSMSLVPKEMNLPCHRVVNSQGRLVPGWTDQKLLLEKEGIIIKTNGCVNLKLCIWEEIL
jgi:methylated-DNA--[protein]-cysteine S-methyltransferase